MYIIFKTSQGNIKVSGSLLVTIVLVTFLSLITMIRAADYASNSVEMNGTVSNVVQVNISSAVQRGIQFGTLTANTNDNMAENDTTGTGNCTEYWVGSDTSTTGTLDLWHYATNMDRGGVTSDYIGIGNVTNHANKSANGANVNMTEWQVSASVALTSSWVKIGGATDDPCNDLAIGSVCHTAYWLDVPSTLVGGTYNTTYNYCGNLSYSSTPCQ